MMCYIWDLYCFMFTTTIWYVEYIRIMCEFIKYFATTFCGIMVVNPTLSAWLSGIQPHQDGPAYFPVVAILSLGSSVVMDFTPHSRLSLCTNNVKEDNSNGATSDIEKDECLDNHHPFSVLLMPRSLLIFKDEAYSGQYFWLPFACVYLGFS